VTDLTDLVQGDNRSFEFEVLDHITDAPVSITDAVIKWTVKSRPSVLNSEAKLFFTTYDPSQIAITDGPGGLFVVQLRHPDTKLMRAQVTHWDVQLSRKGASLTSVGTLSVDVADIDAGFATLKADASLNLDSFIVGDILEPAGVPASNKVRCTIEAVDKVARTIKTDYLGWVTEASMALESFRADVDTPIDGRGRFNIVQGVTI